MFLAYSGRQRLRLLWHADETTKGSTKIFATPSGLRGHLGLGGTGPSLGEVAAMTTLVPPTFQTLPCQGAFLAPPPTCAQGDANTLFTSPLPQHTRVVLRSKPLPDPHSNLVVSHTTIHNRRKRARVGCIFSISPIPVSLHRSTVQLNSTFCVGYAPQKLLIVGLLPHVSSWLLLSAMAHHQLFRSPIWGYQ
jgi:hypothetical protein